MPRAACAVILRPPYRGELIAAGLQACGYKVSYTPDNDPRPGDVFVMWNRYGMREKIAQSYERAGGHVLVVENGYFGRDWRNEHWYAISKGHHNGGGAWREGGPERWDRFGIELQPWRTDGQEIVVLASRGFGAEAVREPKGWSQAIVRDVEKRIGRRVRVRAHPGPDKGKAKPLEQDIANSYAVVTWGSTAALKALVMGIPVFHGFPKWIGAGAARPFEHDIQDRFLGDRLPMLRRLAWAMWEKREIEKGEPFRWLLT